MKKIESLTRGQMAWALTRLVHWLSYDHQSGIIDQEKDVNGADTVDVLCEILDGLRILPKHHDGRVPPWVVGWSADGKQYCLKCRPKIPATTKDDFACPIIVGDPDWGEGSVPVCKDCKKEIFTIYEFPNPKG